MWACDCLDQQNTAEVMSFQVLAEAWKDHSFYLFSWGDLSCHMDRSYLTTLAGEIIHRDPPKTVWEGKVAQLSPASQNSPPSCQDCG